MSSVKNPRKIFVSNIAKDVREKDLYRLFSDVGKINRIQYKSNFAFIEYDDQYSAEQAIKKLHTMEFNGRRLTIEPYCYRGGDSRYRPSLLDGRRSRSRDEHSSSRHRHHHHHSNSGGSGNYRIIVTGLEANTSWQDLKDFGRTGGRSVTFADVYARRGLKEGIIEYYSHEDFTNALKTLDDSRLNGVRVRVYDEKEYQKNVAIHTVIVVHVHDQSAVAGEAEVQVELVIVVAVVIIHKVVAILKSHDKNHKINFVQDAHKVVHIHVHDEIIKIPTAITMTITMQITIIMMAPIIIMIITIITAIIKTMAIIVQTMTIITNKKLYVHVFLFLILSLFF